MAKGGKVGQTVTWVVMGMLVVGLSGLGFSDYGASIVRIASVGDQEVSTEAYFRELRTEMTALNRQTGKPVSFTQAQAFGLDAMVRQRLISTAVLDDEAARIGISVGDAMLAQEILAMPNFQGPGGFDRAAYAATLRDNGWKEAEFEERMRRDLSRALLQTAAATGFAGSDVLTDTLIEFVEERRDLSLLRLDADSLTTPIAALDEAALRAFYEANPQLFTRPESRKITWAGLLVDDVAPGISIDDAELRRLYDSRIEEFVRPEHRLVERLVFPDDAAATEAMARIDAGTATFEDLVRERGLDMNDVDMGDMNKAELGEAGEAIFALAIPGTVGPLPSNFGPALYRMSGILAAEEITFEQARGDLVAEFAVDAARRAIAPRATEIDDLLAAGANLEDLARDAGMKVETIILEPGQTEGVAGYPAFRERAGRVTTSDFPEVFALPDGSLMAIRLDEILPPALRPWDEVKDEVARLAQAETLQKALAARAAEIETAVAGGAALGDFGIVETFTQMPRGGRVDAAPADLIERAFGMDASGEMLIISEPGFTGLMRLDTVTPADQDSPEAAELRQALLTRMGQELGQDAFQLLTQGLLDRATIKLDDAAINAIHAQMN